MSRDIQRRRFGIKVEYQRFWEPLRGPMVFRRRYLREHLMAFHEKVAMAWLFVVHGCIVFCEGYVRGCCACTSTHIPCVISILIDECVEQIECPRMEYEQTPSDITTLGFPHRLSLSLLAPPPPLVMPPSLDDAFSSIHISPVHTFARTRASQHNVPLHPTLSSNS